jgi:hypothetical protein
MRSLPATPVPVPLATLELRWPRLLLLLALPLLVCAPAQAQAQAQQHAVTPQLSPDTARSASPQSESAATDDPALATSPADSVEAAAAARLRLAHAHLAREPRVEDVVAAALAAFDAGSGDPQAVAARARRAGWVPRLTAGVRRGQGLDYASYQGDTGRLEQSTDGDLTLYAALTFELDRVVFRSEEVGLLRERRAAQQARVERAEAVLALYYERQRALLELAEHGDSPERSLALAYSTARLDAFTNGEFTRMIRASGS